MMYFFQSCEVKVVCLFIYVIRMIRLMHFFSYVRVCHGRVARVDVDGYAVSHGGITRSTDSRQSLKQEENIRNLPITFWPFMFIMFSQSRFSYQHV